MTSLCKQEALIKGTGIMRNFNHMFADYTGQPRTAAISFSLESRSQKQERQYQKQENAAI